MKSKSEVQYEFLKIKYDRIEYYEFIYEYDSSTLTKPSFWGRISDWQTGFHFLRL